jgi:hypothetical protein
VLIVLLRLGWEINETLFSSLKEDESFYAVPDKLRHPLIFYITHPAVFYINKLREVRPASSLPLSCAFIYIILNIMN